MKFRTKVSILTIVIIGLFAYAVYLSFQVQKGKSELQRTNDDLVITNKKLETSYNNLRISRDSLENVMKKLNVWETSDQKKREKQEKSNKYILGIEVQADNENYQKLIAYLVNTGYNLKYLNKKEGIISGGKPVIYYYSEKSRPMALQLKADLETQFSNMAKIQKVQKGSSSQPPNLLTIKLIMLN